MKLIEDFIKLHNRAPKLLWANSYCLLDTSSGASISIREMLRQLSKKGFEIEIVGATIFDSQNGTDRLPYSLKEIKEMEASYLNIPDGPLLHRLVITQSTEILSMRNEEISNLLKIFRAVIDRFEPDILFLYGGNSAEMFFLSEARDRKISTLAYVANANYGGRRWCRDTDKIITDTKATAALYYSKEGIKIQPIGKFINLAEIIPKNHKRQNITFINPSWQKGAGIVAQLAYVMNKNRPDIKFEIVESRGSWPKILQLVTSQFFDDECTSLDNVILTPNTRNISSVYSRSRIILLPSVWWESGSRVLAEAMLNGVPALVTNRGGSPEIIGDGGIVFELPENCYKEPYNSLPPLDLIKGMAELIEQLWDKEDIYLSLVANSLKVGNELHKIEISTLRLVEEILPLIMNKNTCTHQENIKSRHKQRVFEENARDQISSKEEIINNSIKKN